MRTGTKWILLAAIAGCGTASFAGTIQPGDLVVYRVGDGTGSLVNTGNSVFLDEYTTSGALVQSIAMPTANSGTNHSLIASGTATSEGLLSVSANGQYVFLTGYNATPPQTGLAGTAAGTVNRVVGRVDLQGNVDTTTALTDYADGNNPRSVASDDGNNIWVSGGAGGVRYTTLGSSTSTQLSTTATNLRQLNIFGGQLFTSNSSGNTIRVGTIGTGLPTTSGQTITNLPGLPASTGNPFAFFLADIDPSTPGLDTLYIADDGAGAGILKYALVNGSWTADGTITAASVRGLTGTVNGTNVTLYGTTGGGSAAGGGSIYAFTDSTGFNGTIAAGSTASTIATAASNEAFRGIGLVSAPEPATMGLLAPAGLLLLARRRRQNR
ncbi:MAG TPA: PEP-CTERM sorting domain-containing protein [Humisphaera sp.]|jgi:hypothetical protein|nr:PEP-CTERM sorting domain-containing protein [Humisphaera sp.]